MAVYKYKSNLKASDGTEHFTVDDKIVSIGEEVELSEAQYTDLSNYFVLEQKGEESDDLVKGQVEETITAKTAERRYKF